MGRGGGLVPTARVDLGGGASRWTAGGQWGTESAVFLPFLPPADPFVNVSPAGVRAVAFRRPNRNRRAPGRGINLTAGGDRRRGEQRGLRTARRGERTGICIILFFAAFVVLFPSLSTPPFPRAASYSSAPSPSSSRHPVRAS